MKTRFLILFVVFYSTIFNLFGQKDLGCPFIKNYPPKSYNGSTQNWVMIQDSRGVIYVGNTIFLMEFDGINWKKYPTPNNSAVRSLDLDKNGRLYIGATREFGYLSSDSTGDGTYVSLIPKLKKEEQDFNEIHKVICTEQGVYFISINKIFYYHSDSISVIKTAIIPRVGESLYENAFITTKQNGICRLKGTKLEPLPATKKFDNSFGRILLLPYENQRILIITENKGFFLYNLNPFSVGTFGIFDFSKAASSELLTEFDSEAAEYAARHKIYCATQIDSSQYALGTQTGGIVIMNKYGKILQIINKNRGLMNNLIISLMVDKSGNLWAGNSGISHIEISNPTTFFNENSGVNGSTYTFIRYKDKIYTGTSHGLFYLPPYKLNLNNDKNHFLSLQNYTKVSRTLKNLNNHLLVSTNEGLYQIVDTSFAKFWKGMVINSTFIEPSTIFSDLCYFGNFERFGFFEPKYLDSKPDGKMEITEKYICKDFTGNFDDILEDKNSVWVTTMVTGIHKLNFLDKNDCSKYQHFHYDTLNGLKTQFYNMIYRDGETVHFSNAAGNFLIKDKNVPDSAIQFVPDTVLGKELIGIRGRYRDSKNQMWIFYGKGPAKFSRLNDGKIFIDTIPFRKMLEIATVFDMFPDSQLLWFMSNAGLFRFDTEKRKDFLQSYNCLIRKVEVGKNREIFSGIYYDDKTWNQNTKTFDISVPKQPENLIPKINHSENTIRFNFAALYFENEVPLQYQHILEGFDKEWSVWSTETKAVYTNLFEGRYKFRVKARNIYGIESFEAVYEFHISPPWYRTIFAYLVYFLLLAALFYIGIRLYARRLEQANIRLEKIVQERTAEIRKQNNEILHQNAQISQQKEEIQA